MRSTAEQNGFISHYNKMYVAGFSEIIQKQKIFDNMEHVAAETTAKVKQLEERLAKEKKDNNENVFQTEASLEMAKKINDSAMSEQKIRDEENRKQRAEIISRICPSLVEGYKNFYKAVIDGCEDVSYTAQPPAPRDVSKPNPSTLNLIKSIVRKSTAVNDTLMTADQGLIEADSEFSTWAPDVGIVLTHKFQDSIKDYASKISTYHKKIHSTNQNLGAKVKEFGLSVNWFETFETALQRRKSNLLLTNFQWLKKKLAFKTN
jgi:hypothetical protein